MVRPEERRGRTGHALLPVERPPAAAETIRLLPVCGRRRHHRCGGRPRAHPPRGRAAVAPTQAVASSPTQTPSPTPTRLAEHASDWVTAMAPTTTPTPWIPPTPAPPRRREPTPTPSAADCITASYDAHQSLAAWGNVLIDIHATNRCRRVLQPTDVLFRVSGFRDGALVQTAQGSPFQEIYPGRSTDFGIGLPGSLDW